MSTAAIATLIKMVESLPESTQEQVVAHLREYVADLHDELRWQETFERTQPQLSAAAQRARQEIAEGKAQPMNYDQL
ncbi:hypothetical protein [Myxacorys almedinensis]|uniref:Uncharacterized protein n=1 Tax=Myxacorys almedinensis A TaxID=2690445 RepID=A0A8J7Z0L0_9CYAN|nr:hypothetical protein [Myxacorys almedinensis]NDJ15976.1 hypothetical protein [Myxacorys almedinensis A]